MLLVFAAWFGSFFRSATAADARDSLGAAAADGATLSNATLGSDLDCDSNKLTNLSAGTSSTDAVNLGQVQALVNNLDWKPSVKVATTANITLSGGQTIDGVSVSAGDRVLVKDQSTASQNGIYVVASGGWSRAADADADAEVTPGLSVSVEQGTVNAATGWRLTTTGSITVGSTSLTFTMIPGVAIGSTSPSNLADSASAGSSSEAARADHVHSNTGLAKLAGATFTGTVQTAGLKAGAAAVGVDTTASTEKDTYLLSKSSGNVTLTLPPATGSFRIYTVAVVAGSSNTATVAADGSDTIRNDAGTDAASMTIALFEGRKFIDALSGKWIQIP
jgi:phage-related tail fiber protein